MKDSFSLKGYAFTHFKPVWNIVNNTPWISRFANRIAINGLIGSASFRPLPLSMYSPLPAPSPKNYADFFNPDKWHVTDYISWQSLTDKTFSNRHLPPADASFMDNLPRLDETVAIFMRGDLKDPITEKPIQTSDFTTKPLIESENTSVLFMAFAQWFTDSFLRVNPIDLRRNTSNHEIDLCQIYGLNAATTDMLRSKVGGKLKSQILENGKEFLPYLFDENGVVKLEFANLPYYTDEVLTLSRVYQDYWDKPEYAERKKKFFVTGLERGNSTMSHAAFNTLFMRAHNKICDKLAKNNWDDERTFQTSRNTLTVILLRLVVEEYINHIGGTNFKFKLDNSFAEKQDWYRTNWISTEFDLLYRWHPLIPDVVTIDKKDLSIEKDFSFNNPYLETLDVRNLFINLSKQKSGKITLGNTPVFMWQAEARALAISRGSKLRSYNEYREHYGMEKLKNIEELTSVVAHQKAIKKLYGNDINKVELTIGLFAEESNKLLGDLMTDMVASEAFSHALTNPLLSKNIFMESTFGKEGWQLIHEIMSLKELVAFTDGGKVDQNICFTV